MNLEALLRTLQVKTVETLLAKIEAGEATPADLNVVRALLKDNGITCEVHTGMPSVPEDEEMPFITEGMKAMLKKNA